MSYNQNFYNNFHGNATFQNAPQFLSQPPPPPPPPAYFIPPHDAPTPNINDLNFVKQFESKIPRIQPSAPKPSSISIVRDQICSLIVNLKELKRKEEILSDKINDLSDVEWSSQMRQIEECKSNINNILSSINNLNLEVLQKLLAKRSAKRARLKRLRSERKKEKEEWINKMQERSRQIDEKLQKIKDDISKAKQEEEAKAQADSILKETLRKKHDAKKYLVKLDALMRLRQARCNTARGRGEPVSAAAGHTFNNNIEKLKSLWTQRLAVYEKEEMDLRVKLLTSEGVQLSAVEREKKVVDNLALWKDVLFGGATPQADFRGDIASFISVRSQWDAFLTSDGSSLPVGWVPPPPHNFSGDS